MLTTAILGDAWYRCAAALRRRIPAPCPMCAGSSRGGDLCAPCHGDVLGPAPPVRCRRCALRLVAPGAACPDCAGTRWAFDYALAAFDYQPPADALLLQFKTGLRYGRAIMLGDWMAQAVIGDGRGLPAGAVLLPVPSSLTALRRRGFNPAAELARAAGRRLALPVRCGILVTAEGARGEQKRRGRRQRLAAGPPRYHVRAPLPAPVVVVVDDVMTTGATLQAAALALKAAGAASVIGLAAARTPTRYAVDCAHGAAAA